MLMAQRDTRDPPLRSWLTDADAMVDYPANRRLLTAAKDGVQGICATEDSKTCR